MAKFSIRKNNVGRAIIRFLIGLLILAILLWVLFEFVLNGSFDLSGQKPDNAMPIGSVIPTDDANSEDVLATIPPEDNADTGEQPVSQEETDDPEPAETPEPTATAEPTPEPTATPVPTPEPTATPAPTATPIPAEQFSARYNQFESLKYWGVKKDRIDNGVTRFEIPASNGGKLISLTGWGLLTDKGFNGAKAENFIMIIDRKQQVRLYKTTRAPGATGMTHNVDGVNLDQCDFTAMIDVSDFANGDYQIGVAVSYVSNGKTYRYAYTFGDAYNFTVAGGVVSAVNGIEQ